jgi:hypothetical protein
VGKLLVKFDVLRMVLALALPIAIGACNSEKKAAAASGAATGEVLPGSANDAMLPLDSVRSQPSLADSSEADNGTAAESAPKRSSKPAAKAAKQDEPAISAPEAAPAEPKPGEE